MSVESAEQQSTKKYTGCVKWFNNKSGYGFITLLPQSDNDTEFSGRDIFSHHSSIKASGDLYKYLVQGEYVEFDVQKMDTKNNDHEHQAVNITGIMKGDLMCETRFKNKDLSRVRDGFAPPRRIRAMDRGNNNRLNNNRGRQQNRSSDERTSQD